MKILVRLLVVFGALISVGCIRNDIPFPVIKGEVLVFEAEGQAAAPEIDLEKRIIKLTLLDTVDIRAVELYKFNITDGATCTIDSGAVINLSKPLDFEINTYQTYKWRIETIQPIHRSIQIGGQIGNALVDVENHKVIINVAQDQDLYNIKVDSMQIGPSISTISPDPLLITNFSEPQVFEVSYFDIVEQWTVYVFPSSEVVATGEVNAWAKFAYLQGTILAGSADEAGFEIAEGTGGEGAVWTKVPDVKVEGGKISGKAAGLQPGKGYAARAYLGTEFGEAVSFTTEAAGAVPNLSFDDWSKDAANEKQWNPCASGGTPFWTTGNQGVVMLKPSNTTPVDDSKAGKAARMETVAVAQVDIAAGNIFTGVFNFAGISLDLEKLKAYAVMGSPYTSRPTSLTGWYKYSPSQINVDKGKKFPDKVGTTDKCNIYVIVENWGGATQRPTKPLVLGRGELLTDARVDAYTEFTFPITYTDTKTKPTHITICATPSYLGADFCGGIGSTLFVDEFVLGFD